MVAMAVAAEPAGTRKANDVEPTAYDRRISGWPLDTTTQMSPFVRTV